MPTDTTNGWMAPRAAAVLLLTALAGWGGAAAAGAPRLELTATHKDLGVVRAGESARLTFPLRNTGSAPLQILGVEGDCGCIRPSFPKQVPAGAAAAIDGIFEAEPMWGGRVEKSLRLRTNDVAQPELRLVVTAQVLPFVRMEPRSPLMLPFEHGGRYEKEVLLVPRAGSHLGLSSPRCDRPFVHAQLVPPGGSDPKRAYRLRLTIGPVARSGDFTATVKLTTSEPKMPEAWFVIAGLAKSGPVVSPDRIVVPARRAGALGGELARLQVFTRTGPMKVLGVETGSAHLKAELTAKTPGHFYEVAVRPAGTLPPGILRATLRVRTDDPETPVVTVPFSMTIDP